MTATAAEQTADDGPPTGARSPRRARPDRARATRRTVTIVVAIVACYFAVLCGLIVLGNHVGIPDEQHALSPVGGGVGAAANELLGKGGLTDFLADYASADAMRSGVDPYDTLSGLTDRVGYRWDIGHANPHPPTQLVLVLPFTLVRYDWALAAWALAMVGAYIATARILGLRLPYAIALGVVIGLTFPGAYGIGNPVPVIGLGVAIAWRWRAHPMIAAIGLVLATAPKVSGVALLLPFLLSGRVRAAIYAAVGIVGVALVPFAFRSDVWSRYLDAGSDAITANIARSDNASLLHTAESWGLTGPVSVAILLVATALLMWWRRDLFWPAVWSTVAVLPLAWMYSVLTLLPVLVWSLLHRTRASTTFAILAAGLTVASPPLGHWPVVTVPVVVGLTYAAIWTTDRSEVSDFWPPWQWFAWVRPRSGGAPAREPEDLGRLVG